MALPLYKIQPEVLQSIYSRLSHTLGLPRDWASAGWAIDIDKLLPEQEAVMDDGGPLQEWVRWWVDAGAHSAQRPKPDFVVLQPGLLGRRSVEPLSESTVQNCFDTGACNIDGGFALVWGMPTTRGLTAFGRIRSADAVLAIAMDGCCAIFMTSQSNLSFFTHS